MSSTPARYQPSERLIDDPTRLTELYHDHDLTVREIADHPEASVSRTRIWEALHDHGLVESDETAQCHTARGTDPPVSDDWSATATG